MINNVYEYLENSKNNFPNKTAYADNSKEISYRDLFDNSQKLASSLLAYKNAPIAILMDKSVTCIETMMGIIASGNFYTILDIKMPESRVNNILDTLNPKAIITISSLKEQALGYSFKGKVLTYEELIQTEVNKEKLDKVRTNVIDTDPVYVLFTSGSTGIPKGYTINHRGVIDFCEAMTKTFNLSEKDVWANQSPLYFDLSIGDIYCNIKNASTNYLIPQIYFMFPIKIIDFLNEHKVNSIFWIPSALILTSAALEKKVPEHLKRVLFCGEVMPNKQLNIWRKYLKDTLYANLYGPAETVDASTYYVVNRSFNDDDALPIGKPFSNTRVLVINEENKEVTEKDEVGELCIVGSSLAMGYYDNYEKTKSAFVQNPLNDKYTEIIYKTGDLVKYNEFNELVYVCRKDYQIKHMGYRIELGEIENAVNFISEIIQGACIYDDINKNIVLFYQGQSLENSYIISKLNEKLPKYMLPNKIIQLENLPHNFNDKVDRKELKENLKKYENQDIRERVGM